MEKRACIAIDVSKGKSHYQGWINENQKCGNPKCINHDKDGFAEISSKVKEVEKITGQKPVIVFESTGVYHRGLKMFLKENNLDFIIISPLASAKVRKSNIRSTKTDQKDCKNIAKVYFLKDFAIYNEQDEIYENLLEMNRYYNYLTEQLKKIKIQFKLLLDVVFPKFDCLYEHPYLEIPMMILSKYTHPNQIKNKHPESIAKWLEKNTCHHYNYCLKEAKMIIEYCNECQPGCEESNIDCKLLNDVVIQIKNKLIEQDYYEEKLIDLAKELPNYQLLLTIPGIANNLASRIIAELGELNRFSNARQVVAYAGIDPNIYQSGENTGMHLRITKKGNKNLRCLLYLAIGNTIKGKNKLSEYYYKKIATGMLPKVAKVACMNKLLRIIYSMCKTGSLFEEQ